jgi:membrane-bound ClpP family serine protease
LSVLAGLLIAAGVLSIFGVMFHKTQSSSEGHIGALVGSMATVISPIPPSGVGEIAYVQGGSRYTAPAREQSGVAVATGQTVKITRIAESQFFVSTLSESAPSTPNPKE